jgi:cytochrome d ubiquinol oxidase subunit II
MTLANVLIAVLWAGLTLYAVLGGADFGAGVLHLRASRQRRAAIATAMGPVWEANHVWLIFFLTGLLTLFPGGFAALGTASFAPATLALFGIAVRGAAFAFASQVPLRSVRLAFGIASVFTPFVFGALAAGLATRASWVGVFEFEVGLLGVAACVALAACFLTVEMPTLAHAFRPQAFTATVLTAALAGAGPALALMFAHPLFDGLMGRGLPAVLVCVVALAVTLIALLRRRDRLARAAVAISVAALLWGWGLAQYPRLAGSSTVANAAASPAELRAVAIALAAGVALLAPAAWLLYVIFRRTRAG